MRTVTTARALAFLLLPYMGGAHNSAHTDTLLHLNPWLVGGAQWQFEGCGYFTHFTMASLNKTPCNLLLDNSGWTGWKAMTEAAFPQGGLGYPVSKPRGPSPPILRFGVDATKGIKAIKPKDIIDLGRGDITYKKDQPKGKKYSLSKWSESHET